MESVETMDKKHLVKLISSFVMGDGGVYYSGNNCRYIRNQLAVHKDYLEFQAEVLSEVTSCSIVPVKDDRDDCARKPQLRVITKSHPLFTQMRERFYTDGYKGIDPHYLKLLDWQMMAHLFMDDGSNQLYQKDGHDYLSIRLNTKRLSYGDSLLLKKAIKEKLDVEFNIQSHYHRYMLGLRSKDQATFLNGVRPFMFPSFDYKMKCPDDWPRYAGGDIVRPSRKLLDSEGNYQSAA